MGLTRVRVTLKGIRSRNGIYQADFLVDTGATDSMARYSVLFVTR